MSICNLYLKGATESEEAAEDLKGGSQGVFLGGLKGAKSQNSLFGGLMGDQMTRGTNGTSGNLIVVVW